MNSLILCSVVAQIIVTIYFIITHWVPLFPWNDLQKVTFVYEKPLNFFVHCIQVVSIIGFALQINAFMVFGLIFWSLWMYGQIIDWWIPYFYGVSEDKMVQYQKMYGATYSFFQTQHKFFLTDFQSIVQKHREKISHVLLQQKPLLHSNF
jgi:hypothetical protein